MRDDLNEIDSQIQKLQERRAAVLARKEPELPVHKLARWLHAYTCRSNHIDACSWEYEDGSADQWERRAHKRYLELAKSLKYFLFTELGFRQD